MEPRPTFKKVSQYITISLQSSVLNLDTALKRVHLWLNKWGISRITVNRNESWKLIGWPTVSQATIGEGSAATWPRGGGVMVAVQWLMLEYGVIGNQTSMLETAPTWCVSLAPHGSGTWQTATLICPLRARPHPALTVSMGCSVNECVNSWWSGQVMNMSLTTGIAPHDLKTADIKPLLKKPSLDKKNFWKTAAPCLCSVSVYVYRILHLG